MSKSFTAPDRTRDHRAGDNLFVNGTLVREGYAVPYTSPPNVAHTQEFVATSAEARQPRRGFWSACR